MDSFYTYIHILSSSLSFLNYVEKNAWVSKYPENGLLKKSFPIKKEIYFSLSFSISVAR